MLSPAGEQGLIGVARRLLLAIFVMHYEVAPPDGQLVAGLKQSLFGHPDAVNQVPSFVPKSQTISTPSLWSIMHW